MSNQETGKTLVIHKIGALVMIVAAAVLLTQAILMFALPENDRIELIKAGSKAKRDRTNFQYPMVPNTDEEVDQYIESHRAEGLELMKKQNKGPIAMKFVFSVFLLITAWGLFKNHRILTRVLAIILTIFLLIVTISVFKNITTGLSASKYLTSPTTLLRLVYFVDMAMTVMIPLALIFSLITAVKPPPRRAAAT